MWKNSSTFSSDESTLRFECALDTDDFGGCPPRNGVFIFGLQPGSHTFSVRAVDLAGNVDPHHRVAIADHGKIIATGTPAGVGAGCKPPEFLKPGDVVELGIEGLGRQRQEVVAYAPRP